MNEGKKNGAQQTGNPVLDSVVNLLAGRPAAEIRRNFTELYEQVLASVAKGSSGLAQTTADAATEVKR